jgi:hypothetical protein
MNPNSFKFILDYTSFVKLGAVSSAQVLLKDIPDFELVSNIRAFSTDPVNLGRFWSGGSIVGSTLSIGWIDEDGVYHSDYLDPFDGAGGWNFNPVAFKLKSTKMYVELILTGGLMSDLTYGKVDVCFELSKFYF